MAVMREWLAPFAAGRFDAIEVVGALALGIALGLSLGFVLFVRILADEMAS